MPKPPAHLAHIQGWGIDADPQNDPTYPMRTRKEAPSHQAYQEPNIASQAAEEEILQSNERPNLSAVFGTSAPPSGLSGVLRRLAFKRSESSYGRWLPLMLADRINMVEGVIGDLAKGHVPNIPAELGWHAEWQHNRGRFLTRLILGATVVAAVVVAMREKDDR